jgi:hypothetical protein
MSPMPEGWSVDTDGSNIILKIPSGAGNYVLSAGEAEALKNQLEIAHLIASRRELGIADPEVPRPETQRDLNGHHASYDRYQIPTQRGYAIRDLRETDDGRPRIEAWIRGWYLPIVGAVEDLGAWHVMVDPEVAEFAGLGSADLTALAALSADHALEWVCLVAALYVMAVTK